MAQALQVSPQTKFAARAFKLVLPKHTDRTVQQNENNDRMNKGQLVTRYIKHLAESANFKGVHLINIATV